ncbi:unnamed protein product [Dovyalis caffra]|uniref:Uncharacterized protein n=1 Tax=Dovyalis caffra TaxID=77055 RepID=A0AAV1S7U1_9ROSI|nr:unnamed protein product [Dovyalis caffra]
MTVGPLDYFLEIARSIQFVRVNNNFRSPVLLNESMKSTIYLPAEDKMKLVFPSNVQLFTFPEETALTVCDPIISAAERGQDLATWSLVWPPLGLTAKIYLVK